MKVQLPNSSWGPVSILRQTIGYTGVTNDAQYVIFPWEDYDYTLLAGLGERELYSVAKRNKNTVWFYMENPLVWRPSAEILAEIDFIVSPFPLDNLALKTTKIIQHIPCVPWFYGIEFSTSSGILHKPLRTKLELGQIISMSPSSKSRLLSMIVSGKSGTQGHQWRKYIADAFKSYFGSFIDIFGFGHNPMPDKANALDPYAFSIVIENDDSPYYITEKITDCLIGWSIPIYSGSGLVDKFLGCSIPRIPFGCSAEVAISLVCFYLKSGGIDMTSLAKARQCAILQTNIFESLPRLFTDI
jgi:hypothetical protein